MNRNHIALPALLIGLTILLTGCESFMLIGSVNIGDPLADAESGGQTKDDAEEQADEVEVVCWPQAAAAVAEMRSHGYTPAKWPSTADWFRRLEPVKDSLPMC